MENTEGAEAKPAPAPEATPAPPPAEELPATGLAALVAKAREKVLPEVDKHGPAAVKAMAAIVRDLKGMPELAVTRETGTRLRISRKGKVGFIVIEYDPKILVIEVSFGGLSADIEPGAPKAHRHTLQDGTTWARMDGAHDLFTEIQGHILKLYPELADEG